MTGDEFEADVLDRRIHREAVMAEVRVLLDDGRRADRETSDILAEMRPIVSRSCSRGGWATSPPATAGSPR